ncbi:SpoIIE family protein phosphatase [Streptomyces sp. NPDC127084]|uniref:SpoIIE family protein phosphatase n=1 Tax=Streptomyces sp. NPDC127084 TaxID=3347133 RepID=UPI003653BFEC
MSWPDGAENIAEFATPALFPGFPRTDSSGSGDPGKQQSDSVFQPRASPVQAGFFSWDVTTGQIDCDPPTFRLHGLPEDSTPHLETFLSRIPESDLPEFIGALQSMTESGGNYQIAYRVPACDGVWRSLEARGRMLADGSGVPTKLVGMVMDTTATHERHEAEKRRLHERTIRTRRMQRFTTALAAAATVKDILEATEGQLRDFGADGLAVVSPTGDSPVLVTCGDKEELAAACGLVSDMHSPVHDALARQAPVFVTSAAQLAAWYPQWRQAAEGSRGRAWAAIPMTDAQGPIGVCLVGFPSPQEFDPEERGLLVAVAGLLSQSLERARMYELQHALAADLQCGMLPAAPPAVPGLTIAARYRAATSGMRIGGDWYDAICLPESAVALVVGDVQGHNVHAASLMGKLRTAVRAYASEGHGPAAVLARTNRLLVDFDTTTDEELFATCCYLLIRPTEGTVEACTAGHPSPALVAPNEPPRLLDLLSGPPLGVDPEARYPTQVTDIRPGSVLAIATDGLLEASEGDIGVGIKALLAGLAGAETADLEVLADNLITGVQRAPHRNDDIAILLARLVSPASQD